MAKPTNIIGSTFGRLTVISRSMNTSGGKATWECICACGNTKVVIGENMRMGRTKSCGCWNIEVASASSRTHGKSRTLIYMIWTSMKQRCENPNNKDYKEYGGRGVKVCDEWHIFEKFLNDMGEKPKGLSLDRKDVNGDYCKDNCRWATNDEQANNTRQNVNINYKDKTQTLSQWAKELNLNYGTINSRYRKGDCGDNLFRAILR